MLLCGVPRKRTNLPYQARAHHLPLSGGRPWRCAAAHAGCAVGRTNGPTIHNRQSPRRQSDYRRAVGGEIAAGRLHTVFRQRHQSGHQRQCAKEITLRSDQGFCAGIAGVLHAVVAGGAPFRAREERQGVGGAGARASGQTHLCLGRAWLQQPSGGRVVQVFDSRRSRACAVQGCGPGDDRRDRRPRGYHV